MPSRCCLAALLFLPVPSALWADGIERYSYPDIIGSGGTVVDFSEPGKIDSFNDILEIRGIRFGERFRGQSVAGIADTDGSPHDILTGGTPAAPLTALPGARNQNVDIEDGLGSLSPALLPDGPAGYPNIEARGEGAFAIEFAEDQCAFGLLVYLETNVAPSGGPGQIGNAEFRFFDRNGRPLGVQEIFNRSADDKRHYLAFHQTASGKPVIAGVFIQNMDIGGITIDDVAVTQLCPKLTS